jgi:Lipase maturation factor
MHEERLHPMTEYWYSRWLFERALAAIYCIAFAAAAIQFVPLLGERGLEPVGRWVQQVPFRASPSLFYLVPKDGAFRACAWVGIALSALALSSLPQRWGPWPAAAVWAALWLLYLSFVNIGQTFYGFGWETLLCEVGFFAIFAGAGRTTPNVWLIWIWRWTLFRLMFGAGLIKLRGDACWRDLTCLDYYFETQPMPNALSWYFHWMPHGVHAAGVVVNHLVELAVPFGYFAPQPLASIAGIVTILFQLTLIVSGNLSWLNWLTIVLCIPLISDRWLTWLPVHAPADLSPDPAYHVTVYVLAVGVALLSIGPVINMLSSGQMMNASFEPLHLVNTYGAFGSITRERYEIVLEGTGDQSITERTDWREYEFKGKPGDPSRRPPQVAPYHLRLGWLMWFEAMAPSPHSGWFFNLLAKVLQGDQETLRLLRSNPFPGAPPRYVRAQYYRYRFTTPEEHRRAGRWWTREVVGTYYGPVSLPGK